MSRTLNSYFYNKSLNNTLFEIKSACWSPDEQILLFSCYGCSLLYCLKFLANNKQELQIVCDLSSIVLCDTSNEVADTDENAVNLANIPQLSVGGSINNIAWDPTGQRLAVTFKSNLIVNDY